MSRTGEIYKNFYKIVLVVLLAIFLVMIFYEIQSLDSERYLSDHYISKGVQETGAINIVTSVLYDFSAFDTLGEATVILIATSTLAFLVPVRKVSMQGSKFTIIVYQAIKFIVPFLAVLGSYLIVSGHLSPGGGFVGGVVLAFIPIVVTVTYGVKFSEYHIKPNIKKLLENLGAIGFILLGLLGVLAGSNFLANGKANFNLGTSGELISAGLIPYLNIMIGIKVGTGLATIFNSLVKEEE